MLALRFTYKRFQQGLQYTDGHEWDDVRHYCGLYLEKLRYLETSHVPPPTCDDRIPSWNAGDKRKAKRVILIYPDETTFARNDALSMGWHDPEGSRQLRPKSKGRAIMIRNFVEEYGGFLRLSDDKFERAQEMDPAFPRQVREVFLIGKKYDGYWTNAHLMANVRKQPQLSCSSIQGVPSKETAYCLWIVSLLNPL